MVKSLSLITFTLNINEQAGTNTPLPAQNVARQLLVLELEAVHSIGIFRTFYYNFDSTRHPRL
ncbi:hypothetical protein [Bartonella sp. TT121SHDZB]|uniref:hypothetical protein n=1 Tax=Bartonella sp. TT121SHDZB TaxID=3243580 RepID=UPI0035CEEC11